MKHQTAYQKWLRDSITYYQAFDSNLAERLERLLIRDLERTFAERRRVRMLEEQDYANVKAGYFP